MSSSSDSFLDKLDSETRDVIDYLRSRSEVCDLNIQKINGASSNQINEWEIKNFCCLPQDLKAFYANHDGMSIEWKFKLDNDITIPLGKIKINSLKELTKVGSVLNKDYSEPSVYDLDDLQDVPKTLLVNSSSSQSISSLTEKLSINREDDLNDLNIELNNVRVIEKFLSDEENEEEGEPNAPDEVENEIKKGGDEEKLKKDALVPHFDARSCNFELDNCNGYGKVCLVYRNSKPGMMSSDQSAEIWFLDRSLQWHYLTNSFKNYYRLLIAHLGLPQWQMLFTKDGLPPFFNQWFYLLAPGRILIHQEDWKNLEFLNLLENKTNQNKKQTQPNENEPSKQKVKIDFSKLFDDKSKTKSQQNEKPASEIKGTSLPSGSSNLNLDKNANVNNLKSIKAKTPTFKK